MNERKSLNIDGGLHAELLQECEKRSKKGPKLKIQDLADKLLERALRQLQAGDFTVRPARIVVEEQEVEA